MTDLFLAAHSGGESGGEAIAITAIIFGSIFLIIKTIVGGVRGCGSKRRDQTPVISGLNAEEADRLDRIQRILIQTESRIEALETILAEKPNESEKKHQPGIK